MMTGEIRPVGGSEAETGVEELQSIQELPDRTRVVEVSSGVLAVKDNGVEGAIDNEPPAADIALPDPEHDEPADEPRDRAIRAVVRDYAAHPKVALRLASQMSNPLAGPPEHLNPRDTFRWISSQFKHDDEGADVPTLIAMMNTGVATYLDLQAMGAIPEPGGKDEAALVDLAYAYQRIYLSNLKLVAKHVDRLNRAKGSLTDEELCKEGAIGLSRAIMKHRPEIAELSTYATRWIKQAVGRAIETQSRAIHLPSEQHQAWLRLRNRRTELETTLQRRSTIKELAAFVATDAEEVALLLARGEMALSSIDARLPGGDEDSDTVGSMLPAENDTEAEAVDAALLAIRRQALRTIIDGLGMPQERVRGTLKAVLTLAKGLDVSVFGDAVVQTPQGEKTVAQLVEERKLLYGDVQLSDAQVGALIGKKAKNVQQLLGRWMPRIQEVARRRKYVQAYEAAGSERVSSTVHSGESDETAGEAALLVDDSNAVTEG